MRAHRVSFFLREIERVRVRGRWRRRPSPSASDVPAANRSGPHPATTSPRAGPSPGDRPRACPAIHAGGGDRPRRRRVEPRRRSVPSRLGHQGLDAAGRGPRPGGAGRHAAASLTTRPHGSDQARDGRRPRHSIPAAAVRSAWRKPGPVDRRRRGRSRAMAALDLGRLRAVAAEDQVPRPSPGRTARDTRRRPGSAGAGSSRGRSG